MISEVEIIKIKQIVLEVIEENKDDISSLFLKQSTGEIHFDYFEAETDEAKMSSIKLELITTTRVSLSFAIKSTLFANIPELYSKLELQLKERLSNIQFNLYSLKLKVLDIE